MKGAPKVTVILLLAALMGLAFGDNATIRITTFPNVSVADARSTITVTAEVRDSAGRTVPDGTQVVFSTTLGSFRQAVVTTMGGLARGILVAGGLPGTAHITVTSGGYAATSTAEVEFLSDASLLSSAKEYVEIVSPSYLAMSVDTKVVAAAEPDYGAHLRYRDVEVDADDLQLNAQTNELRARHAKLKIGHQETRKYEDLYMKLSSRRGVGSTDFLATMTSIIPSGNLFVMQTVARERFGYVEISANGIKPLLRRPDISQFKFEDISQAASMISARKAVVFPHKEVQFQKAELLVGGEKTLKFPLFEFNLNGGTPIITDQIVNVNDNHIEINYPQYLSLKPGQTSLLRFRTGQSYGRDGSVNTGAFLDYELNWNRGDQMDGGLVVSGLTRRDYDVRLHQSLRLDSRTNAFAQLDTPAFTSIYGSLGLNRQMNGYTLSLNGNSTQSLRGLPFKAQQLTFTAEKDPVRLGKLPIQMFWGLTAFQNASENNGFNTSQTAMGLQLRNQLLPQVLDKTTTFNASLNISELTGVNTQKGLTEQATAFLTKTLGRHSTVQMTYDYLNDGFSSSVLGHHLLTMQGGYTGARTGLNILASRSLDADRFDYEGDFSYRISGLWRIMYRHTFDSFLGTTFLDYNAMLTYRLGLRDIGLTWSRTTKRFGLQILGATFN